MLLFFHFFRRKLLFVCANLTLIVYLFLSNMWKQRLLMLHIHRSTQSIIKKISQKSSFVIVCITCVRLFTLSMVKTSLAFVSPPLKPNHDHHQSDCLFSIPFISRKQSVRFWQEKKGRGENSIPKRWEYVLPVMTNRAGIFSPSLRPPPSLLIPLARTTPIQSINITHLVAVGGKHVSSRFFLKGQVATDGRAGIPWRVGNIVAGRDCGSNSGGASPDGRGGAVRQPEVTVWSQTGLSKPGWDSGRSLIQ